MTPELFHPSKHLIHVVCCRNKLIWEYFVCIYMYAFLSKSAIPELNVLIRVLKDCLLKIRNEYAFKKIYVSCDHL